MPTVSDGAYVHGYDVRESERLGDQAGALVDLLHHDTSYPDGSSVLEAGCGVGAQTVTLATRVADNGSAYFHPDSAAAREAIRCLVDLHRAAGGTRRSAGGSTRCSPRWASRACRSPP